MIAIPADPPRDMIDRVGGGAFTNLLAFAPFGSWAGPDPMSMDESRVRANEYQDYTVFVK